MKAPEYIASPTPKDYRVAAEYAFMTGNLEESANMIAAALAMSPTDEGCFSVLDRITQGTNTPLELFNTDKNPFFGRAAVRARLLAKTGRYSEALDVLAQVVAFRPGVPYLIWVLPWLRASGKKSIWQEERHTASWKRLLEALSPPFEKDDPRSPNANALTDILTQLVERHRDAQNLMTLYLQWQKQLGQPERALETLSRIESKTSGWSHHARKAQVLRQSGKLEESIASFETAAAMHPKEPALWLDLSDLYLETGKPCRCLEALAHVLDLEPHNLWAQSTRAYVNAIRRKDAVAYEFLQQQSNNNPRAATLLRDAELPSRTLNVPDSPGTRVLHDFCRRALEQNKSAQATNEAPHLKLRVIRPEPPSFHRGFRYSVESIALGEAKLTLIAETEKMPQLDSDTPAYWDFTAAEPTPKLTPPSAEAIASISHIAGLEFDLSKYLELCASLSIPQEQLAAAAFHAPAPKLTRISPAEWIFRYQVVCLLALAFSETGWVGSARRRWLYELATGPVDWISAAAMIALGAVAQRDAIAATEIEPWFAQWLTASPEEAPYCYEPYLIATWMQLPQLSTDNEGLLWRRRVAHLALESW